MNNKQDKKETNTYSLFHNYKIKYNEKNFIIEGKYDSFPFWHRLHDEEHVFDYNLCGIIQVYMSKKNEPELKILSRIDGGYFDDDVDYYVSNFAYLESENENGEKNKLPEILKLYFKNYVHGKDTNVGTILNEDDIKHLHDKKVEENNNDDNNNYYSDDDYGTCPMCSSSSYCDCASKYTNKCDDDDYDGCDDFSEYYCDTFSNK